MFDQVFDCLNVSKFNKNVKGKKELSPYFDANDWRFRVSICINLFYAYRIILKCKVFVKCLINRLKIQYLLE